LLLSRAMVRDGTGGWRLHSCPMAQSSAQLNAERRRLRALRLALPGAVRRRAERRIARTLSTAGILRPGRRVAAYLAMPGEASLAPAIEFGHRIGVRFYVPVLRSSRRRVMDFAPLDRSGRLVRNFYGLLEPATPVVRSLRPSRLDVVLVPLLGFDRHGQRLGMGGGYYDRALRHRAAPGRSYRRPLLVGIAYACQELPRIEAAHWDVALDLIVTEHGVIRPRSNHDDRINR
jgi:5-formyltetrahydrofolate cyclo-ligase